MNFKTMDKSALICYIAYHTSCTTLDLLEDWSLIEGSKGQVATFTYFRKWARGI
jgi:hypothetical protein